MYSKPVLKVCATIFGLYIDIDGDSRPVGKLYRCYLELLVHQAVQNVSWSVFLYMTCHSVFDTVTSWPVYVMS